MLTVKACPALHSADEFPVESVVVEHDSKVEVKVEVPIIELLVDMTCDVILLMIVEVATGILLAEMTWKVVAQDTSNIASNIAKSSRHLVRLRRNTDCGRRWKQQKRMKCKENPPTLKSRHPTPSFIRSFCGVADNLCLDPCRTPSNVMFWRGRRPCLGEGNLPKSIGTQISQSQVLRKLPSRPDVNKVLTCCTTLGRSVSIVRTEPEIDSSNSRTTG